MEGYVSGSDQDGEQAIRKRAYLIWKREGCPNGRALDHWVQACAEVRERQEHMDDEEKVLAGRLDANMPALLTKDVQGG